MADPRTDRIAARHVAPHIRVVTAAAAALAFWQIGWISVQAGRVDHVLPDPWSAPWWLTVWGVVAATSIVAAAQALRAHIDKVAPPVVNDGDIDPSTQVDDPLAAEVARLSSLLEAVLADPEIAKVADIEAIRTAAEGSKGDDALILAVAKVLGADPAEVRKKRDADPQWFADVVAKYGLGGGKSDEVAVVKG